MEKKSAAAFVLFLVVFNPSEMGAFEVMEPSEPLEVRDNEALQLTCTGSEEWLYCRWKFYDRSCSR